MKQSKLDKVWKVIRIILVVLLCVGVVGLITYYCIAYSGVKSGLQRLYTDIKSLLNYPLPIIGISVLTLVLGIVKIVSMTDFGKKRIDYLTNKINGLESEITTKKEQIDNKVKEIQELKTTYQGEIDYLKCVLQEVCSQSPNKKIKEIGTKLNDKWEDTKNDIALASKDYYNQAKETLSVKYSELKEYVDSKQLQEYIEKVINDLMEKKEQVVDTIETIKQGE